MRIRPQRETQERENFGTCSHCEKDVWLENVRFTMPRRYRCQYTREVLLCTDGKREWGTLYNQAERELKRHCKLPSAGSWLNMFEAFVVGNLQKDRKGWKSTIQNRLYGQKPVKQRFANNPRGSLCRAH